MRTSHAVKIFLFTLLVLSLDACREYDSPNVNSNRANVSNANNSAAEIVPQDNVEELGKIVKLDVLPEEATYSEAGLNNRNGDSRVPAPDEKKLVAVLRYSVENAARITAQAEKHKPAEPYDIDAETWFPAELVAQSQLTGDESLKGAAYSANDFIQAPYTNGKLTRIDNTDYFILELTTF